MISQGRISEIIETVVEGIQKKSMETRREQLKDIYLEVCPSGNAEGLHYQSLFYRHSSNGACNEPVIRMFDPAIRKRLDELQESYYTNVTIPSEWLGTLLRNAFAIALSPADVIELLPKEMMDIIISYVSFPGTDGTSSLSPRAVMQFKEDNSTAIERVHTLITRQALGVI